RPSRRRRESLRPGNLVLAVVAWLVGLFFFFPVLWMFLTGFKQESQASTDPSTFFFKPTLDQYQAIFSRGDFAAYFWNSIYASAFSIILVILLATPAAYALSIRPVGA